MRPQSFYERGLHWWASDQALHYMFPVGPPPTKFLLRTRHPCQIMQYLWHILFGEVFPPALDQSLSGIVRPI